MATATVNRKRAQVGWSVWLQWVLATIVCGPVRDVVLPACIGTLGDLGGNVVGNTASGLVAGIGQWLVLRRWLGRAGWWWVLATAGGDLLGASPLILGENLGGLIATIALGLVPGTLQWLLLRRQVARAGWWVLASTVSVLAAFTAGVAASSGVGLKESELVLGLVAGIASGSVFGIMSGLVLGWLLRQPVSTLVRGQATTA